MGMEYELACSDCYEFLSLRTWAPLHVDPKKAGRLLRVTAKEVWAKAREDERGTFAKMPKHCLHELLTYIYQFLAMHEGHALCVANDTVVRPWSWSQRFYLWKEMQGPPRDPDCFFLPRNFIEDEGVRSPGEAIARMRKAMILNYDKGQEEDYIKAFTMALARSGQTMEGMLIG